MICMYVCVQGWCTYVVVVGGPHLETPVSYFSQVLVRGYYILEGITPFPFTLASS